VERVDASGYSRSISVSGNSGTVRVSRGDGSFLCVDVRFPDPRRLLFIVERARRMFDLGADPEVIAGHLSADSLLRRPLARHPGIRTPGAWDAFELAVRAILGQQVSVSAATTIAGRIADMFGTPIAGLEGLDRLFPTPEQLQSAPLERAGVMPSRAETIRTLAQRVAAGVAVLDDASSLTALRQVPGIGDWTASYVAMRAFGEPDAFPNGDLVLRRAAGNCSARDLEVLSQAWRPWRSYAVMLLWQGEKEGTRSSPRTPS
jgi:AraC family transcriptional regulator of adaptative response / DNA-3-methyladenine glycosylase II